MESPVSVPVLLVEDDSFIRMHIEVELEDAGFAVYSCATGASALERLAADLRSYRAVVDFRLGDGPSGWEVARYARELSPNIPIV
jgi:CheY-like chemotaxis protein